MDIKFTKDQLETLAKALFVASWIGESGDEDAAEAFHELEQHVLKAIHEQKTFPWVEYDAELEQFCASDEVEDQWVEDFIEAHDDEHFWQTLEMQLAQRDLLEEFGEATLESMDSAERMDKLHEASVKYSEVFAEEGIVKLKLVK